MLIRQLPPSATPIDSRTLVAALRPALHATDQFQVALSRYLGRRVFGLADSGRTVLYTIFTALARQSTRREVIIPAYTCPSVPKTALDAGLQPVLVDISPQTLAIRMDDLRTVLSEQTLAVVVVHPFGLPHPVDELLAAARQVGAVVIEDAAQALGARRGDESVGLQGDFGVFSLGPGKPISTGGGGVLVLNNAVFHDSLSDVWRGLDDGGLGDNLKAGLRQNALTVLIQPPVWRLFTALKLHELGNNEASWGYSRQRLSEAQGGVGLRLLARLDTINEGRRKMAQALQTALGTHTALHCPRPFAGSTAIYLRLPILVRDQSLRELLFEALWHAGIGVGKLYQRPLSETFPSLAVRPLPGATDVARQLLTLPTHYQVTPNHVRRVGEIAASVLSRFAER